MAAYSPYSVVDRLSAAQGKPLTQRCTLMEEILSKTSIKELKSVLPYILQEIFDFEKDQNQGWQLDRISRSYSPELFHRIFDLLSPEGLLMNVVNCLHADPYATYEFPLKCIPGPARKMIEEGAIPSFYLNKLQAQNYMPVLVLNAFELFVFHLAYGLVNPIWQSRNQGWNDLYEFIYPTVLDNFLVYFLPCDKSSFPSVPHLSGPVMRPSMASGSPGRTYGMSPNKHSPTASGFASTSHRSLFKPSFINAQKQHQQSLPVFDQAETEIWRSETFLQIIAEFWLNQNTFNGSEIYPISSGLQEHFMPTMNHVKMVRLLVKYLHHFANSATLVVTSPYQQSVQSPLDQFKRSVIPCILQKKIYTFLRHAFDRWPLDSCFRMVLETWLSYIQPWRYMDFTKRTALEPLHSDVELHKFVDDRWESFIEDNLLFYTNLTSQFLPRVSRMDLTSPHSAYMVYRVSRILSLPNLPNLIRKAEQELFVNLGHHDLGGSYLSGPTMPSQMMELEGPSFQYVSFFSEPMKYNIRKVLAQLSDALETVRSQHQASGASQAKADKSVGFFASLFSFGGANDATHEFKRLPVHLEQSIHNFCHIFDLPKPSVVFQSSSNQSLNMSMPNESVYLTDADNQLPECVETEAGFKITDRGRRQLINRERKFDMFYVGDPDLLPVRSYENATLVRMLFHFCSFINFYFYAEFNSLYHRPDIVGHFARVFLIAPSAPEQLQRKLRSPISEQAVQLTRSHQARISLRFLASYHIIMHIGIMYLVVSYTLGFGLVKFVFLVLSLVFLYGFLVAGLRSFTQTPVQ